MALITFIRFVRFLAFFSVYISLFRPSLSPTVSPKIATNATSHPKIIEQIVDAIPTSSGLDVFRRVALVSRSFSIPAQRRLFHTVTFKEKTAKWDDFHFSEDSDYDSDEYEFGYYSDYNRDEEEFYMRPTPAERFYDMVLENSPHLGSLVKVLHMYDAHHDEPYQISNWDDRRRLSVVIPGMDDGYWLDFFHNWMPYTQKTLVFRASSSFSGSSSYYLLD
ncbi:hypothetical protein BT96DRAFT_1001674 [Gymnopus androsaceus JB14]|uniref:Uncharacterized protein n=1 Tax=Gymnopus androsaceus JB14 TaxID=1447944 RepID=A0A6A4H1A1_9AGAR|nr:hypothetical protein BT96DRAFT_1001674 [Gymnopus androsaceus JB14]